MRPPFLLVALQLLLCNYLSGQNVVINEVLAANRAGPVDDHGEHDDAVELFNPSNKRYALGAAQFVLDQRSWTVPIDVSIPAKGHLVLWFDGRPDQGPLHASLKLPRSGGTLLLMAPDGTTILDVFHYPELTEGISFGRYPDGGADPGYFKEPTLGRHVVKGAVLASPTSPPELTISDGMLRMEAETLSEIKYALGGHDPLGEQGVTYTTPITVAEGTVVKAIAVRPNSMPSKARLWRYRLESKPYDHPVASIIVQPDKLWADGSGINVPGDATNYSRSGPKWQRKAFFGWGSDSTTYFPVGIAVAGSGSRSLPKRSFKLLARSRFGSDTGGIEIPESSIPPHEAILRADATDNAFLHNLFMEVVAQRAGGHVDVGSSIVVPLELNGAYWGQYRLVPPKDPEWVMNQYDVEAIDMLAGPSLRVVEGDRNAFHEPLALLSSLISVDDLQQELRDRIDLRSLIDLAAFDLYTGRADHDINVRCWRPKVAGSKWRWILYDMDLWASADDRTLQRMASTAHYEAPFLRTIVEDEKLRVTFLARFGAMLNTLLLPERASLLLDSLYVEHRSSMVRDHERWASDLGTAPAEEQFGETSAFITARPAHMFQQVSDRFDLSIEQVDVRVIGPNGGSVLIDGLPLTTDRITVTGWEGVPLMLEAIPAEGMEFAGWKGMEQEGPMVLIDPSEHRTLKAVFRPRSSGNGL